MMKPLLQILTILALTIVSTAQADELQSFPPSVERGRYVARVTGCNDCHTAMYGPKNGDIPEKDWMTGVPVGWKGPWGTTYASNLRQRAASMSENDWVTYLKNLKSRPPMPFFAVNAMNENDARSLYRFLKKLGNHPQKIPEALPPGQEPQTPYFDFDLKMPKQASPKS